MDKESKESRDNKERVAQSGDMAIAAAKKRAVRILGNRYMSRHEIEKRLVSKGDSEEAAKKAVNWLEEAGAINDEEYAAMIGRHYTAKGYGQARIRDELYRRGIPREMWDAVLDKADGIDEAAIDYLKKKLNGSSEKENIRRAEAALLRRGFSYDEARNALNMYLEELQEKQRTSETCDNNTET